ncbi:type VI secretion system-associated protein TagF [Sedimentitalea sp. JM2-8]|uniref:Type VI secretion system-associated protein TagF n=1 Tax=Sedimentitalea xiamensis TaxID=3050037 RepID=A0ABT7FI76_9RHOB|nr:type VI secretion system-associated protein TagF [Sedimentitalea xiamensis]MDK3074802.1 type VI secretion system-associated protein TagF [Sedimentitalea xiamensis]
MDMGFGAFGKMPSVGDFFRLGAPPGFVAIWDDWIQKAMLVAQSAFGPDWDSRYMSAPIWRFGLSAGLAGPAKIVGVVMPSVDRVGRRFPLTLMAPVPAAGPILRDHFGNEPLFETLEDLVLDALDDGMSRDMLEQRLKDIPPPENGEAAPLRRVGGGLVLACAGRAGPLPDLAAALLAERHARPSIWSANVRDSHRLLICDGLPGEMHMQALFHPEASIWHHGQPA